MRKITSFLCLLVILILLPAASTARGQTAASVETPRAWLPLVSSFVFEPVAWLPMMANQPVLTVPPPTWSGQGGSIVCLVDDPRNPDILYAGTWGGGVFRSTNQGSRWAWAGSGLTNFLIDSLVVDPSNTSTLYAGTHGSGVFKSEDSGQHWRSINVGIEPDAIVYTLAVNPVNNQVLYAGTRKAGGDFAQSFFGTLYKSTNGGATWYPVLTDVGGAGYRDWVYSLAIKPDGSQVIAVTHQHGPYRSSSGEPGDWRRSPVAGGADEDKGRAAAFDPRSGSSVAFYATWHGGFYRSTSSGGDWQLATEALNALKVYPNGIVFAREAPDRMFLATMDTDSGVMQSVDAGRTWASIGLNNSQIYTVLAPGDGGVLLAGTVGEGLYKSDDGGETWYHSMNGLSIQPPAGLEASAAFALPPEPVEELRLFE